MSKTLPRQTNSGNKYLADNGIVAIKDGIKVLSTEIEKQKKLEQAESQDQ